MGMGQPCNPDHARRFPDQRSGPSSSSIRRTAHPWCTCAGPALQFVADGVFYAELNELLTRELAEDGYSGVEVRVTPMRTEIIIRATRTQNVLGEHGARGHARQRSSQGDKLAACGSRADPAGGQGGQVLPVAKALQLWWGHQPSPGAPVSGSAWACSA